MSKKKDGYDSDEEEYDYDEEEKENERLRHVNSSQKPHRFYGLNATEWYCDVCQSRINTYDPHYHCFECPDYDLCQKCHSLGRGHMHGKEDFMYLMPEPNWYFTNRIMDDKKRTVTSVIMKCFDYFQNRHFIGFRNTIDVKEYSWYRYSHIRDMMLNLAKGMKNVLSLKKGDFVSILCDIQVEPVIAWFSCMYLGVGFVPLQGILPTAEKKYILQQAEVKTVFCGEEQVEEMKQLALECKSIQNIVVILNSTDSKYKKAEVKAHPDHPEEVLFSKLILSGAEDTSRISPCVYNPDDIICIIYTSGTTGFPKGIVFRERGWLIEMTRLSYTMPLVVFSFLPYSHISGISDILVSFFNGGRTGLLTQSDMNYLFDDFKLLRPTILSTIPRVLNFVYAEYQRRMKIEDDADKVKKDMRHIFGDRVIEITVGSAHCSNKVKKLIREVVQVPVYDGYGISEVGTVSFNYRIPPGVNIKLVDCPELGYFKSDKPYPRGELLVKNKLTQTLEYYKNQDVTKRKFDKDGYFHTGDIVEKRGDRIILIDRKNNILKLAQGEFVSLENVEKILETSGYVDQVVLSANPGKTFLVGLVTIQEAQWEALSSRPDQESVRDLVKKDMERIGKRNSLNTWEFPATIRLIYEKFPLTELKKKSRKRILKKHKRMLQAMYREKSDESGSDLEELMKNLGISLEGEAVKKKTLRDLGVQSFTGIIIRNQIEQSSGMKLSFKELMTMPVSRILQLIGVVPKEGGDEEPVSVIPRPEELKPEYINLYTEEEKFKNFFATIKQQNPVPNDWESKMDTWIKQPRTILLTGGSGFLGQNLLLQLVMAYPRSRILCLVRPSSKVSGINLNAMERLVRVDGDLGKCNFGMEEEKFNEVFMKGDVDLIVHCGAMVNHFADYGDHYDANVRSLYDLVKISKGYKPIVYVSTLSVFRTFPPKYTNLEMELFPYAEGYGGSKWMTDCLVRKFIGPSSLVVRPTLLIGDTNDGRVNLKDWMSRIIFSCLDTKTVPTSGTTLDVPMDMLQVDFLGESMVKMMKDKAMYGKLGKNISFCNATVGDIMNFIYEEKASEGMRKVSYMDWIFGLEKKVKEKVGHPITPFLGGFKRSRRIGDTKFLPFDTSNYETYRKEWRKMSRGDMRKYIEYISANMK